MVARKLQLTLGVAVAVLGMASFTSSEAQAGHRNRSIGFYYSSGGSRHCGGGGGSYYRSSYSSCEPRRSCGSYGYSSYRSYGYGYSSYAAPRYYYAPRPVYAPRHFRRSYSRCGW